ncbi:uncharacterized protein MELLADRAFT_85557 [Melampsora larici-populina 98AG31]|uniref:Uncharacterized protein n=1 Tax=Melampsora larici-populina (strain 98AG31 / pathotype 3-4-7) TaxID=747676 RepID=F4RJ61_MELLP|nr:uncharacterized protein MELLADRAFT_85557 [Melampsora larici-populina 98AG31]EGG07708.1 hypothetical protein MELLADRAFT_85557 [Melampsora larici-populina 98AG31]
MSAGKYSENAIPKPDHKAKKTFSLPLDRPSFKTFIDDNNILDDEGYPLFPNGNTVFVRQTAEPKVTNWGTFGFAYTSSGGGRSKGPPDWRTVRYTCLGVIIGMVEQSGWGIIQHSGVHQHRWPRRGKPDKLSLEKFGKKVVENPEIGPLRHKVGRAPAGKQELVTASNIHHAFGNLHRTGYYRRKLLQAAGVIPEKSLPGAAGNFILDMELWSGLNEPRVGSPKPFALKSLWMEKRCSHPYP